MTAEAGGWALVTGGTSGIGLAFADRLAAEGYGVIVVASKVEGLDATAADLAANHGVEIEKLQADLSTAEGMAAVEARLESEHRPVDVLINNAGIGLKGAFVDVPPEEHERLIAINVLAVTRLTRAALRSMIPRGRGEVVNVASVAAFTPGFRPSSTYAASKAFVVALTEGLVPSLDGTGVHITALCPGFVRTNFHHRAGLKRPSMPHLLWLDADEVAAAGLRDVRAGRAMSVPGIAYKALMAAVRVAPRPLVRRVSRLVGRRSH